MRGNQAEQGIETKMATVCECGAYWGNGKCSETIEDGAESRTVEYMPEWLQSSHEAAGNSGSYPANGARRIDVSINCIDAILDSGDEWVSEVEQ